MGSDGLTKRGPGARKVRGHYLVFPNHSILKQKVVIVPGPFLLCENKVIPKKGLRFSGGAAK